MVQLTISLKVYTIVVDSKNGTEISSYGSREEYEAAMLEACNDQLVSDEKPFESFEDIYALDGQKVQRDNHYVDSEIQDVSFTFEI